MTAEQFQQWLGAHGHPVVIDGRPGPLTRQAILAAFANTCADAVTEADIVTLAQRLGCTAKQIRAVARVESGGAAFDDFGRPKILFERHYFHRLTSGKWSVAPFSNGSAGGYNEKSWDKLTAAACCDADAAFASASWGKFQVMGAHWKGLGYPSPIDMAYSTVTSEAAHYDMLARFIEKNGLKTMLAAISTDPDDCRAFAKAYNGAGYERFAYHTKLAGAMR